MYTEQKVINKHFQRQTQAQSCCVAHYVRDVSGVCVLRLCSGQEVQSSLKVPMQELCASQCTVRGLEIQLPSSQLTVIKATS